MAAQLAEVEEAIDATQQVTARNLIVEVERVEESILAATSLTHHLDAPVVAMGSNTSEKDAWFFNWKGLPRPAATLKSHGIECQD